MKRPIALITLLGIVSLAFATGVAAARIYQTPEYPECSKAFGTAVADYDGDQQDDVFITGHDSDQDRIWHWRTDHYEPSTQTLRHVDRHDCDAADVNRDGRMDFYCAVGADKGVGEGDNQLWVQNELGEFLEVPGGTHGAEDRFGSSRRPIFFNFDGDIYPDIYSTNELHVPSTDPDPEDGRPPSFNRLFVNNGSGGPPGFHEVVTEATANLGWACVDKGDIDSDGYDDLLLCSDGTAVDNGIGSSRLLMNRQGTGFDLVRPLAMENRKLYWARLHDLNEDGHLDLLTVTSDKKLEVWLNSGTRPFFQTREFLGDLAGHPGKSLTVGDFDGDNLPDIYVARANADCGETEWDTAPDVVFWGKLSNDTQSPLTWERQFLGGLQPAFKGCGREVQTLENRKVLLVNGTSKKQGWNYVLSWSQSSGKNAAASKASNRTRTTRSRPLAEECTDPERPGKGR